MRIARDRSCRKARRPIPLSVRFAVFNRDCFRCRYCGAGRETSTLHVDHVEPVSKGGSNLIENLVTACKECNLGKSDRDLIDPEEDVKIRLFRALYALSKWPSPDREDAMSHVAFSFSNGLNDQMLIDASNEADDYEELKKFISLIESHEAGQE